jgi:hypothetical protein
MHRLNVHKIDELNGTGLEEEGSELVGSPELEE